MPANRPTDALTARAGFAPTLLSNLLPLAGIAFLDWRISELFTVYWLEIWVALLAYAGAALFAQRPLVAEGRTLTLPGVSRQHGRDESRWGGDPRTITLTARLPPVYPRNLRLVRMSLVWGVGFLLVPLYVFDYLGAVAAAFDASLAATAVALTAAHLLELRRDFFGRSRYEEMSAHMVLEIPCRVIFFAVCYVLALLVVGGGCLVAVGLVLRETTLTLADDTVVLPFVTMVVLGKVAVEWSKHRAETESEPTGFATWFRPEDPRERADATDDAGGRNGLQH